MTSRTRPSCFSASNIERLGIGPGDEARKTSEEQVGEHNISNNFFTSLGLCMNSKVHGIFEAALE